MPRWSLLVLLAIAVLCAGLGTALVLRFNALGAGSFGWTAYAPLSRRYTRVDFTWLFWEPKLGALLLALGAGTTGALTVALRHRDQSADASPPAESSAG